MPYSQDLNRYPSEFFQLVDKIFEDRSLRIEFKSTKSATSFKHRFNAFKGCLLDQEHKGAYKVQNLIVSGKGAVAELYYDDVVDTLNGILSEGQSDNELFANIAKISKVEEEDDGQAR